MECEFRQASKVQLLMPVEKVYLPIRANASNKSAYAIVKSSCLNRF